MRTKGGEDEGGEDRAGRSGAERERRDFFRVNRGEQLQQWSKPRLERMNARGRPLLN